MLSVALRAIYRNKKMSLAVVLILGLGIGISSAMFSYVNHVLFHSLPFAHTSRLVTIWESNRSQNLLQQMVPPPDFLEIQRHQEAFDEVAAFRRWAFNLTAVDEPERLIGAQVSSTFFNTLGTRMHLGRSFVSGEDTLGRDDVVVLSYSLWRRRFAADPQLVGKRILLNGRPVTVIGIAAPDFQFPDWAELWVPLAFTPSDAISYGARYLNVIGRLRDGSNASSADVALEQIGTALTAQFPASNKNWTLMEAPLREQVVGPLRLPLVLLLAAVAAVFLMACTNVASLVITRMMQRQGDSAIRIALGANRKQLFKSFIVENLILALLAGAVGLNLASMVLSLLKLYAPSNIPGLQNLGLDFSVLIFALVLAVITGIVFAFLESGRASSSDLGRWLQDISRLTGQHSLVLPARKFLVIFQISMAFVLLTCSAILLKSLTNLYSINTGFQADNVLTMQVFLPETKYHDGPAMAAFVKSVMDRTASIPGLQTHGAITFLPLSGSTLVFPLTVVDRPTLPGEKLFTDYEAVTPQYFRTLRIPLIAGREFTDEDTKDNIPVAVISAATARRFWPDTSPLGREIIVLNAPPFKRRIVGVVGDVTHNSLDGRVGNQVYEPYYQYPWRTLTFVFRTGNDVTQLSIAFQDAIHGVDRDIPISKVQTMGMVLNHSLSRQIFMGSLFGVFSISALTLAMVGLYALVSYSLAVRTRELGLRLALGSNPGKIISLVLYDNLRLILLGIAFGISASFITARYLSTLLFHVNALDPVVLISISVLLLSAGTLAALFPARRAAHTDPLIVLRHNNG